MFLCQTCTRHFIDSTNMNLSFLGERHSWFIKQVTSGVRDEFRQIKPQLGRMINNNSAVKTRKKIQWSLKKKKITDKNTPKPYLLCQPGPYSQKGLFIAHCFAFKLGIATAASGSFFFFKYTALFEKWQLNNDNSPSPFLCKKAKAARRRFRWMKTMNKLTKITSCK